MPAPAPTSGVSGRAPGHDVRLGELLARRRPGFALERAWTTEPDIHALDIERIWRRSWLFAAHSAELSRPGDLVVFDMADDSVIITRSQGGALHALHNTCRHRGMRICDPDSSRGDRLVCPYHQWSYGLDGRLLSCGGMDRSGEVGNPDDFGLGAVAVREVGGLIFVNLADSPDDFGDAGEELASALAPQGLSRAKLAAVRDYSVAADWKLVWENNRECWHCQQGHPQYIKANFDVSPPSRAASDAAERRAAELASRLGELGVGVDHREVGLAAFPSPHRWWSANRTPLVEGWVTESLDGRPVAPLMGDYQHPDAGTLRLRTLPNFWCHASADHAVTTRLVPAGLGRTQVRVSWLVAGSSVEALDYHLEELMPFWQLTSEQDWELCERNQAGVRSPAFRPGPYSRRWEANLVALMDWYAERIVQA